MPLPQHPLHLLQRHPFGPQQHEVVEEHVSRFAAESFPHTVLGIVYKLQGIES